MRILCTDGNVFLDGIPVTSGQKIYASSKILTVRRGASAGVLTEAGKAYKFKRGKYRISKINEIIERIISFRSHLGAVHRASRDKLWLSGDVGLTNNSGIYGDSILLRWVQMNEWHDGKISIPQTPIKISIRNLFDDTLNTLTIESPFAIVPTADLWRYDSALLVSAANKSIASNQYLVKTATAETHERVTTFLAKIHETDFAMRLTVMAALFEIEVLPYDQLWHLFKLSQLEKREKIDLHPYYEIQSSKFGLNEQ